MHIRDAVVRAIDVEVTETGRSKLSVSTNSFKDKGNVGEAEKKSKCGSLAICVWTIHSPPNLANLKAPEPLRSLMNLLVLFLLGMLFQRRDDARSGCRLANDVITL